MVAVVPAHHALEGLQHGLDRDGVVEDGERAVAEGVGEVARALGRVDLARADDDGRWRLLEPLEELEDARAGGHGAGAGLLGAGDGVHRDRQVDDRDVDMLAADDLAGLVAACIALVEVTMRPQVLATAQAVVDADVRACATLSRLGAALLRSYLDEIAFLENPR